MDAHMLTLCNRFLAVPVIYVTLLPVKKVEGDAVTYTVGQEYTLKLWNDNSRATIACANKHFTFGLNADGSLKYEDMQVYNPATHTRENFKDMREGVSVHQITTPRINLTKVVTVPNVASMSSIINAANVPVMEAPDAVAFTAPRYCVINRSAQLLNDMADVIHRGPMLHMVIEMFYVTRTQPSGSIRITSAGGNTRTINFGAENGTIVFTHAYPRNGGAAVAVDIDDLLLALIN